MTKKVKEKGIELCLGLATLLRLWLTMNIPILVYADASLDDALGMQLAEHLLNGEWLGPYNYLTLQKGVSYSLFLAVISKLNIDYNFAVTICWVISVALFCKAMSNILSKRWNAILYVVLLYNPIMFHWEIMQRVYRSALAPICVLALIALYLTMYFNKVNEKNEGILTPVISGLVLAFFVNLRDDAIFIYPIIIVLSVIIVVLAVYRKKNIRKTLVLIFIPFFIVFGVKQIISILNYHHYGLYITTEPSNSSFRDFRDVLYSIKMDEDIPCVSVSREKLKKAYEASPTLKSVSTEIETAMNNWDNIDRNPGDGEVEDGWIRWALREGINKAGIYSSAVNADKFYAKVTLEIQTAIDNGEIEVQRLLPIDVLPVWKNEYFEELIEVSIGALVDMVEYEGVTTGAWESTGSKDGIRQFEIMTGEHAIYPKENKVTIRGWAVSNINLYGASFVNQVTGDSYPISWKDSPDVANHFANRGEVYVNAGKSRFDISISEDNINSKDIWLLQYLDADENIVEIELSTSTKAYGSKDVVMYIDEYSSGITRDEFYYASVQATERIKIYSNIMIMVMKIIAASGIIAFIHNTVILIWKRKSLDMQLLNGWLIALASFLTCLVLVVPVSLLQITAFNAVGKLYLAPGYVLLAVFFSVSLLGTLNYYFGEQKK